VDERVIEVNALSVRHALANAFVASEPGDHVWRGEIGIKGPVVTVDVREYNGDPYVHARADVYQLPELTAAAARMLLIENGELILGRFSHADGAVRIEQAIMAGSTMATVEVQASVWCVGWAASAFGPRLKALLSEGTPPPPPVIPAGRRRDAAFAVDSTTRRVQKFLEEHYGGFEHHPDWGFHGPFGSARVFVDVLPVLDDSTAVRASSPVLSDIDLTDELAVRLLPLETATPFGSFIYVPARREVWFQHVVLGDDLDLTEFEQAIDVVATTADDHDDELQTEFGGKRYADLGG
jgi:hypothetical protein